MESYVTSHQVIHGKNILPIRRMEIFSAEEWEIFIEEWLDIKKSQYVEIERLGGAGDKGRDVIAYISDKNTPHYKWDCFQCKHYDRPLMPFQMWIEFGKVLYYTFKKEYPVPNKYYFIAPKGCGTSFAKLLTTPGEIKSGVIKHWASEVSGNIISGTLITLTTELIDYINKFDFSIFDRVQPKTIIEEHKSHPNHLTTFGGGLPDRTTFDETTIPNNITENEIEYVNQLVLAYNSTLTSPYKSLNELKEGSIHYKHFKRARLSFHHAEQLKNFSRDNLPNGTFENFQTEIYDAIANVVDSNYENGFEKVKAVETHSSTVQIASNPLKDVSCVKDKQGVCHQLCNERKINWTENG